MTIEELADHGLERMDDREWRAFLESQDVGVLGLTGDEQPYLLPLSFGYDGDDRLYFTFVLGADSRKARLADRNPAATFLAYSARSTFNWESLSLTGEVRNLPESEWESVDDALSDVWRPGLFAEATAIEAVRVYEFAITDAVGIRHTGLPPELRGE